MDGFKKLIKVLTLKSDIISTVLGVILIISLVFIYLNQSSKVAILLACTSGGLINIISGMKIIKDPIRKTTGMTFFMTGIILMVLGYIIIGYLMK